MSSKRGRKRNDNLPPNRARDVQRAFRARRAAHLQVRIDQSRIAPRLFLLTLSRPPFVPPRCFSRPSLSQRPLNIVLQNLRRRTTTCAVPSTCHQQTVSPSVEDRLGRIRPNHLFLDIAMMKILPRSPSTKDHNLPKPAPLRLIPHP